MCYAYLKIQESDFSYHPLNSLRVDFSTLLAQVAKTSQGLIPPSFSISSAKVRNKFVKCKHFATAYNTETTATGVAEKYSNGCNTCNRIFA